MQELVILQILRAGALPDSKGAFVEVQTHDGPRQIRFTLEDADRLRAAVLHARNELERDRVRAGEPALPTRAAERWETTLDPVEQVAVLRTRFTDGTTEETRIPRAELSRVARFLEQALKRFAAGAEMRQ